MSENRNQPLIEVKDLKEYFDINMGMFKTKPLKAVDGVSFSINKGETLGLVGESGCGKTTVGRTLLHLYKPTGGEIWYNGKKLETPADIKEFRKNSDKPVLKAAFAEGCVYVGDNQLDALCNIKSKEELIGDIVALLQSPAKNVISALQANAGQKIAGIVKTLESRNN